jgi:DsbC/DsbD-like thiol-disulfide interchange protein
MVALILRQCVSTAVLGGLLASSAPNFVAAEVDASSWQAEAHSAVRLIAGNPLRAGELRAGVEMRLAPGWKTYWRYPGDSGVPPVFDFSKSQNIKSVSVMWPAPHRFTDDSGATIGYKGDVIFPVHIIPENPNRPATLRLTLDYAVCEKLCVPARAEAVLELISIPSPYLSPLAVAEARVPKEARVGEVAPFGIGPVPFGIAAVRLEHGRRYPRVIVEVAAPVPTSLDLFAEGPTADWALPLPEPIPGAPLGMQWFAFDLDGAPPGVDAIGARLRLTLVSGEGAVEVTAIPK